MKVKLFILLFLFGVLYCIKYELDKIEGNNRNSAYKEEMSNRARVYSMIGMKKVGADIIWIQQTQNIGETLEGNRKQMIKATSLEMSQLNPYFLENYYVSANVLAFIKVYRDYAGAQEILGRGIKYNPKDKFLKSYSAGLIAETKGNDEEVLRNYEEIVKKYPDPLMIKKIYDIYYERVKEDKRYIEKYLYYAEILYGDKNSKYREEIGKDLKELGFLK